MSRILNTEISCNTRKGKQYKPFKLSQREVRRLIRRLSKNFSVRQLSYARLRTDCNIEASDSTIARALKKPGYRRCVACPWPSITPKQACASFRFAMKYRWQGTSSFSRGDWRKVYWSGEATFETGKRGRVLVTRRPDEEHYLGCIKLVYRSGRISVIV